MRSLPSLRRDDGLSGLVGDVAAISEQNLYACYQCGKCTAGCPFAFGPQQVIRHLQLGQMEKALELHTAWECAACMTCMAACPKGVNPARVMMTLRTLPIWEARATGRDGRTGDEADRLESLASIYRSHGKRLRSRLFANINRLSRLGSALAPVSNWLLRLPGAGLAAHYALGIHKARSLPAFARRTFPYWFERHTPLGDGHRGAVLLFHDTFMDFNYPETGAAATELLEKAGFRVELADMVCCGRAMISKGFLNEASAQARTNLARLYERAREGVFIVGCEPSCLLTLRDEYPSLVEGPELKEKARVVAQQALLIDEFLAMLSAKGELELAFDQDRDGGRQALFHAHCHQKALASPAKSMELLQLAGYDAELVNAVCCGMAGAFGYEKEHYDVSRAAGEQDLFPAVRARSEADVVVMGVSCRQQIEHFTGRRARHLAQALRDAAM